MPTIGRGSGTWRWSVALVALAVAAGACTGEDAAAVPDPTTSTIPPAQTLLRVGAEDWPECVNPLVCDSPPLREQILQHVLPVAFELDAEDEFRPSALLDGEPEVELGDDGMRIRYRLDDEARWDDGRPVTSSDLRATWQAVMSTPAADKTGYDLIVDIDDRNPLVAVVHLSRPYAEWRQLFGGGRDWILKGDELGPQLDLTDRFLDELPFAAGPYRLAAWDRERAVLAATEGYWGLDERPDVDQVRLSRVDIAQLENPQGYDLLLPAGGAGGGAPEGFEATRRRTTTVVGVWFDRRTPLLGELVHRQAIAALLDREAAAEALVGTRPDRLLDCLGWLPGVGPWCEAAQVELPRTDAPLASFALAGAGWVSAPPAPLTRGGEAFVVPLTYDPAVPGSAAVADLLAEALGAASIGTQRSEVPVSTWARPRGLDESTGIGVFPVDLGVSPLVPGYACAGGLESSRMLWCPPEVVTAAQSLTRTVDPADQLDLVEAIGRAAGADLVWLPLAPLRDTAYVRTGRLSLPDQAPITGGMLGGLTRFELDD